MKHWYRTPANGRDSFDYGNTRLGPMEQSRFIPPWWFSLGIMVCVVGLVVWS